MGDIAAAKAALGYQRAQDRRDCCAACQHLDVDMPTGGDLRVHPTYRCRLGGFYVTPLAVCQRLEGGERIRGIA